MSGSHGPPQPLCEVKMPMLPDCSRQQLALQRAERAKETLREALERARKASYAATILAEYARSRQNAIPRMHAE